MHVSTLLGDIIICAESQPPAIVSTTLNVPENSQKTGESLLMECIFNGLPKPEINWYKDGSVIEKDDARIKFRNDNQQLYIQFVKIEDEGVYRCSAKNRLGEEYAESTLKIMGKFSDDKHT